MTAHPPNMPALARAIGQADEALSRRRFADARAHAQTALRLAPDHPASNDVMRAALAALGQHEQALPFARKALAGAPDEPVVVHGVSLCLLELGQFDECIGLARRCVELQGGNPDAHLHLLSCLRRAERHEAAAEAAAEAMARFPDQVAFIVRRAEALSELARGHEAAELLAGAVFRNPADLEVAWALAAQGNYLYPPDRASLLARVRNVGRLIEMNDHTPAIRHAPPPAPPPPPAHAPGSGEGGRVRVGVLSSDFRDHSVAFFLTPLLRHLDPRRIELWCYPLVEKEDWMTRRLRAEHAGAGGGSARWRNLFGRSPSDLAAAIARDRIDVLLELNSLSGGNRLDAVKLRPAPVQVTYLGYAIGPGVACIGHRIVDSITDPPRPSPDDPRESDAGFVERLERLDPCFLCYDPPAPGDSPPIGPGPGAGSTGPGVVFGSFNRSIKINDAVIRTWAGVLEAVPGSRLLIKSGALGEDRAREGLARRFAAHGTDPSRLELLGRNPDRAGHLGLYNRVDIALDTFAYAGTTTTCEALHMGVPVVTLAEPTALHAGRVGASLLHAAGLPELVATDREGYVRLAAALAGDPARRAELRATLRARLAASALCDAPAFGARMTELLRRLWTNYARASAARA